MKLERIAELARKYLSAGRIRSVKRASFMRTGSAWRAA